MSEDIKNFRISVYLNNFFHDHRSTCRIFVNRNMKTIGDLMVHIGNIFSIENFNLVSQNHYLPAAEDVRILQREDVVIAVPNSIPLDQQVMSIKNTLKNEIKHIQKDRVKNKRRRNVEEESLSGYNQLKECESENVSKKKKKSKEKNIEKECIEPKIKKKKKSNAFEPTANSSTISTPIGIRNQSTYTANSKIKPPKLAKINSQDTFVESSVPQNKNDTTTYNVNVLFKDTSTSETSKTCKKFSYFESLKDKSTNSNIDMHSENMKSDYIVDSNLNYERSTRNNLLPEKISGTMPKHNIVKTEIVNLPSYAHINLKIHDAQAEKDISDKSCIQNKSVAIASAHESVENPPIISNETPNKSLGKILEHTSNTFQINLESPPFVVESTYEVENKTNLVAITNKSNSLPLMTDKPKHFKFNTTKLSNESNSSVLKELNFTNFEKTDATVNDGAAKPNIACSSSDNCTTAENIPSKNVLSKTTPIVLVPLSSSITKDIEILYKNCNSENQSPKNAGSNSESVKITSSAGNVSSINSLQESIGNNGTLLSDSLKESSGNNEYLVPHHQKSIKTISLNTTTDTVDLSSNSITPENTISNGINNAPIVESTPSYLETQSNEPSNKSACFPKIRTSTAKFGVGSFLESLKSTDSSSNSLDVDAEYGVTKRKRHRIRKRKTKLVLQEPIAIEKPVFKPPKLMGKPLVHIKFNDESTLENPNEISSSTISIINLDSTTEMDDSTNKKEKLVENVPSDDEYMVLDETDSADDNNCNKPLETPNFDNIYDTARNISEEAVLKCPLMNQMQPKTNDVIIFKKWKMNENYTPEISSYITAKVMKYNRLNENLILQVLDGIDEFEEPFGKFSMDQADSEIDDNFKRINWADVITPRLLFP